MTDLLRAQHNLPEPLAEHLQIIHDSGRALLAIVNNILDISKLSTRMADLDLAVRRGRALSGGTERSPVRLTLGRPDALERRGRSARTAVAAGGCTDRHCPHFLGAGDLQAAAVRGHHRSEHPGAATHRRDASAASAWQLDRCVVGGRLTHDARWHNPEGRYSLCLWFSASSQRGMVTGNAFKFTSVGGVMVTIAYAPAGVRNVESLLPCQPFEPSGSVPVALLYAPWYHACSARSPSPEVDATGSAAPALARFIGALRPALLA